VSECAQLTHLNSNTYNYNRLLSGEMLKLLPVDEKIRQISMRKKLNTQVLLASHVIARHMLETIEKCVLDSIADKVNEIHLISAIHVRNRVNTFDKLQSTDGEYRRRNMISAEK
jgi:hypothetical protein